MATDTEKPPAPRPWIPPTGNPIVDIAVAVAQSGAGKKILGALGVGKKSPAQFENRPHGAIKPRTQQPTTPSPDISTPGYTPGVPEISNPWPNIPFFTRMGIRTRVRHKARKKGKLQRYWEESPLLRMAVEMSAFHPGGPVFRIGGRPPGVVTPRTPPRNYPRPLTRMRGGPKRAAAPGMVTGSRPRRSQIPADLRSRTARPGARRPQGGLSPAPPQAVRISTGDIARASSLAVPLESVSPLPPAGKVSDQRLRATDPYVLPSSEPRRSTASSGARRSAAAAASPYFQPLAAAARAGAARLLATPVRAATPALPATPRVGAARARALLDGGGLLAPGVAALPGINAATVNQMGFARGVLPFSVPQEALALDPACDCEKPKKKRKPRAARTTCYTGTFTQRAKGISYKRRDQVPCT